jgi:hypothetical protein
LWLLCICFAAPVSALCICYIRPGDKPYQQEVLIQLASRAGQLAVQQQQQQPEFQAMMSEAQQLAATYGADSWQLPLWFVHSVLLYASDVTAAETQALLAAHTPVLLQRPAAAAAHLFGSTYPLLPAAAANHVACTLGIINSCLQAAAAAASGSSSSSSDVALLNAVLPPLDRLRELLSKSSKALAGLAVKQLIAGQVTLMLTPAVAAANALAAAAAADADGPDTAAQQGDAAADGAVGTATTSSSSSSTSAAVSVTLDIPVLVLEAVSAVAAHVATPAAAVGVAKLLKHLQLISEMLARALGDKPLQQQLAKLVSGVPPGLPHLLLVTKALSCDKHQQRQWDAAPPAAATAAGDDGAELASQDSHESVGSYYSASSRGASITSSGSNSSAVPAPVYPSGYALARSRYCSTSGRQQLPRCSALQLVSLASWLVLQQQQQQPLPEEAVGQLQPLPLSPGLQLQILEDVTTLVIYPEAQLAGLPTAAAAAAPAAAASRGTSRNSSFNTTGSSSDLAAAAAAGSSSSTALLQNDLSAVAAWRPPVLPMNLAPKRRELLQPLLQAAVQIVAQQAAANAVAAAGVAGDGIAAAAAAALAAAVAAEVAAGIPAAAARQQQQQGDSNVQQEAAEPAAAAAAAAAVNLPSLQLLLQQLLAGGSYTAVDALQLSADLFRLQLSLVAARDPAAAAAAAAAVSEQQQAVQAVSGAMQQVVEGLLQQLQQQLTAEQTVDGSEAAAAAAAGGNALGWLEALLRCLGPTKPQPLQQQQAVEPPAAGAAEDQPSAEPDAAAAAAWLDAGLQELRCLLWQQLQQYQAQLPAEAYSSSAVAGLLELLELLSSGQIWPYWLAAAAAAGGGWVGAGGAAAVGGAAAGSGLLLARTLTCLSKQWPGLKVRAGEDGPSKQLPDSTVVKAASVVQFMGCVTHIGLQQQASSTAFGVQTQVCLLYTYHLAALTGL